MTQKLTYHKILITYIVKGIVKSMEVSVTDETHDLILAERIDAIKAGHHITDKDITVQEGLL